MTFFPFPLINPTYRTHPICQARAMHYANEPEVFQLVGVVLAVRKIGKTLQLNIVDESGNLNVYFRQAGMQPDAFEAICDQISPGKCVSVGGTMTRDRLGRDILHARWIKLALFNQPPN